MELFSCRATDEMVRTDSMIAGANRPLKTDTPVLVLSRVESENAKKKGSTEGRE